MSTTHLIRFHDPVDGTSHYRETPVGLTNHQVAKFLADGEIDGRFQVESIRCADEAAGTFTDVTRDVLIGVCSRLCMRDECVPASLEAVVDAHGVWLDRPERKAA